MQTGSYKFGGDLIMNTVSEREFTTYPRQFKAYRWFRPILVGLLFIVFFFPAE